MIEIPLTQGKVALVDDEDARQAQFKWAARATRWNWYAYRMTPRDSEGNRRLVQLHREILGVVDSRKGVDHANGDGLDNRHGNLRLATSAENNHNQRLARHNTTGFKGVSFFKRDCLWRAQIRHDGRLRHLGYFASAKEAARAYDEGAREFFGSFAALNFPRKGEQWAGRYFNSQSPQVSRTSRPTGDQGATV